MKTGDKISAVLVSESGRRLEVQAEVIGDTAIGPEVIIRSGQFKNPPKFQMFRQLIEQTEDGYQYRGENNSGAIMLPDALWK